MKKLILAASIASLFSGAAFSAVNLDAGTGSGGTYAAELVIPAVTGTTLNAGAAADQKAVATLGATFGTAQEAFIRYDLTNGTFVGTPTLASNIAARVAQVSQGGAGQNYVIFAISPTLAGDPHLEAAESITMTAAGIQVTNQNAVTVQYRLYETLTSAVNQTPLTALKTVSGALISFANVINVATDIVPDAVADVAAANGPYTAFVPVGFPTPTYSRQVSNFHATYTQRALASGAGTVNSGDILGATNSVTINGDWSAAENAHIHSSPTCSAGTLFAAGTINAAKTAASFGPLPAAITTQQHWYICYEIDQPNSIAIPASDFTGTVDLVPVSAAVTVNDAATAPGRIVRNGTVLKAAFAEGSGVSGVSSAISLTNTSSLSATFTTRCLTSTGAVAGVGGTVAPRTGARFGITSASGLACPTNVRGIELTFAVPNGSVIGSVVRQNTTTGAAGFDGMVGNQ